MTYSGQPLASPEEALEHFGVKGMKWGVRKDDSGGSRPSRAVRKADKKYEKENTGVAGFVKHQNAIADKINPRIEALNNNPKYKGKNLLEDPALHKQYVNDYRRDLQKSLNEVMAQTGTNASGTRKLELFMTGEGETTHFGARMVEVKHAEEDKVFQIVPKFNATGHIFGQSFKLVDASLMHYGVKGMRWGVRKEESGGAKKPSRAERRALNKASQRKENLKLQKFAQKATNKRDQDILDARARLSRETQKYKDAKAQYKIDKQTLGKATAKRALREQGDVLADVRERSDRLTSREQSVYNQMLVGQAIAGVLTGQGLSGIPNTRTLSGQFDNQMLKVRAVNAVEKAAREGR